MKPSHDDLLRVSPVGLNTAALAWVPLFAKRARASGGLNLPEAAELLAAYPIVALFAEKVTQDILPRETASLLRMRDILGMCQRLKVGELPVNARSTATFTAAVRAHHAALRARDHGAEAIISGRRSCAMAWCWTASQLSASAGYSKLTPRTCARARGSSAASLPAAWFCAKAMRTCWCLISFIGNKTSTRRTTLVCGLRVDDRMAAVVVPLELLSMSATFSTWRQRRHCASLLGGSGAATSSRSSLGDTGKDSVQQSAAV